MAEQKQVYDRVRKEWVKATPEELIRQGILNQMIDELGYPSALISVEKEIHQLPHLANKREKPPLRRADIIAFAKDLHPNFELYPLLMIECKAVRLSEKAIQQVMGYNHYVQAFYVTVSNGKQIWTGWFNPQSKGYQFVDKIPPYKDLLASVKKHWKFK